MTQFRKFQFKSVQSKLIVSFLIIAMLPLLVICCTAYITTQGQLISSSGTLLQSNAKQTLDKIYRNLFERYGDVQAFAFNPQARGDVSDLNAALQSPTSERPKPIIFSPSY